MRTPIKYSWLALLILPFVLMTAYAASVKTDHVMLIKGERAEVRIANVKGKVSVGNSDDNVVSASLRKNRIQLTAKAVGEATLSLTDNSGTTSLAVTVKPSMAVSPTSLAMIVGQTASLSISNPTGPVKVASSNTGVVTASLSGSTITVKALKAGSASLTIRDSKTKLTVPVTVHTVMDVTPSSLTLRAGSSSTVKITNASGVIGIDNSDFSIISSTLSGSSITVTGIKPGSATLTVRDSYSSIVVPVVVTEAISATGYTLVAWNDLGMHCMDADYSVFSILPPFNNLHAQLVNNGTGKLVKDPGSVKLTYEAVADPDGSVNSYSSTGPIIKTNFWDYVEDFFGVNPGPDMGLAGNPTASYTPQAMAFDPAKNQFEAVGIPITPYDDAGNKNTYPMVKVVASDGAGNQLATARVVLPVSDEMSCTSCHATSSDTNPAKQAAKPAAGWVSDASPEREYRFNILRLHDEKSSASSVFHDALSAKGYDPNGLEATARSGKSILCAACHASNALPGTGVSGIKPLTESMHAKHSSVIDPTNGLSLESSSNRNSCYQCHPGSTTKCLRGVMGDAKLADGSLAMQCQSCHSTMSKVGAHGRVGWLEQPNCQACHHDSKRELSAVTGTGALKTWTDTRFATNPNTPSTGFSLYRMSSGHGGLQCEACHGATHAEYPSSHVNDNLFSVDTQGYGGTIGECKSCHKTVPLTVNAGPHGMHTLGQAWVTGHHDAVKGIQSTCTYCHGADYRGSALSTVKTARTFNTGDGRTKTYSAGQKVGCYDCHNGPTGD